MTCNGFALVILSALLVACSDTTKPGTDNDDDDDGIDSDSAEGCRGTTEVCPLAEPDGVAALAFPWSAVHAGDPTEEHADNVVLVVSNMPFECGAPNGTVCDQWKVQLTLTPERQVVGSLTLADASMSWEDGAEDCPHGGGFLTYGPGGTLTVHAFDDAEVRFTMAVEQEFSERASFNPNGDYTASRCPSGG